MLQAHKAAIRPLVFIGIIFGMRDHDVGSPICFWRINYTCAVHASLSVQFGDTDRIILSKQIKTLLLSL